MPASSTRLGPGTLTLGEAATELDASCQVQAATLTVSKSSTDPVLVLCGDVIPGDSTYTYELAATLLQDLAAPAGVVAYSWTHKGESVPFTFTPSTTAGATVEGTLIVDPMQIGGDEYGAVLSSDVTWTVVGTPTVTLAGKVIASAELDAAAAERRRAETAPAAAPAEPAPELAPA